MAYTKEILTLAVEVGDAMLRSGGEIYRVEDSVLRILEAYDVTECDVYVLSNGIFASANENEEDACSIIRHVPLKSLDLGKLTALNQLTRDICSHKTALVDAWTELDRCKSLEGYPRWMIILAVGIGCGGFCLLFGGKPIDGLFAFLIGLLEMHLLQKMEDHKVSRVMTNIVASMYVNILSMLVVLLGFAVLQDKIVIGAIMPIVPGIALTTSIRDFYNGDYLSGTIHMIDALLTALCIAAGVFLTVMFGRHLGGVVHL